MANEGRHRSFGGSPFARLLGEALGRLASGDVSEQIIADALEADGLRQIPEDGATFGSFACGALSDAVEEALGVEAAEAVLTDLGPAFISEEGEAISGVRRRKRHSLAAPHADAPVVLIASSTPGEVDALVPRLRERAKVVAAYDIFALLQAAQKYVTSPLTLLLNDEMPAIRPSTLATLGRVLPAGTRVIVWGAGDVLPEARDQPTSVEWVRMGPVEELDAVADMCLAMMPSSIDDPDEAGPEVAPAVVVAHDDPAWRARLCRALEAAGYDPLSAPDGFMALERCIDGAPAAVVAGLEMATLDGSQLAALLRSRYEGHAPTVLLVSEPPLPAPSAGVTALVSSDAEPDAIVDALRDRVGPGKR